MPPKGGLQAAVNRRTSEIVEDRDEAQLQRFASRNSTNNTDVDNKVRMLQHQLQSPTRAKPQETNAEPASRQSDSKSSRKAGANKDLTPEERQRRAAMAYIHRQEQQALAAVKTQKLAKKKRVQGEAESKKESSVTQHSPVPPQSNQLPSSHPQPTATEEAAAAAASAAAARKKIMELSAKAHSPSNLGRPHDGRSAASVHLNTNASQPPATHDKHRARGDFSQSRASRSVALSKPLSPGTKDGPDFASPSSLSISNAKAIFGDLHALQVPTGQSRGSHLKMTYAQLVDGIGQRPDIAFQLGLPTKTAQEYHLRRLFRLSDSPCSAHDSEVDSSHFAKYFASGGKVLENGSTSATKSNGAVPRLWKAGLTPRDEQQPAGKGADSDEQKHGESSVAPVHDDMPSGKARHDDEPMKSGASAMQVQLDLKGEQNVSNQVEAGKSSSASVTATLIHVPASTAPTPETGIKEGAIEDMLASHKSRRVTEKWVTKGPKNDDGKDTTEGIKGKQSEAGEEGEISGNVESSMLADEQSFNARLEREKRLLREQMEAERRSMQEEVAAARAAQAEAEERATILKDVLSHNRHKQGTQPLLNAVSHNVSGNVNVSTSKVVNDSMVYATEVDDVKLDLILKTEFSETLGREDEFMSGIAADVSAAAGCDPEKVEVLVLQAGSVVAEIVLARGLYTDGRRPMDAVRALSKQLHDPSSILRRGKYTHSAAGLRLRNPERAHGPLPSEKVLSKPSREGEAGPDGDMSRDEWLEKFGAALEDAVNRSSVDRSSLSSSSHNTSFASSQAGDKSACRSARSSFGQDANDLKRDSFNLSNRDSCISNRSVDSDISDHGLAFPSSLGDFVETAVNESLGDLEMKGRVNGDYRALSSPEAKLLGRIASDNTVEEDCMELEGERSKIKQHVQIESILFGGDSPFETTRNGKDILQDMERPDGTDFKDFKWRGDGEKDQGEAPFESLAGPSETEGPSKRSVLRGQPFRQSLKHLEFAQPVSRSAFRQHDPIWELPEAVPDDALDDSHNIALASPKIPTPHSDASRPPTSGVSATHSSQYEDFSAGTARSDANPHPALPSTPLEPFGTTSLRSTGKDKDNDTSMLLVGHSESGSFISGEGLNTPVAVHDGGISSLFASQNSFWHRVKTIGADKSSSATMQAENRLLVASPHASPKKLPSVSASPRVLPHLPHVKPQSHSHQVAAAPVAAQEPAGGGEQACSEATQSVIDNGVLNGNGAAAERSLPAEVRDPAAHSSPMQVLLQDKANRDDEYSGETFELYVSQHMQAEELKARELEANLHLPLRIPPRPLSVPGSASADADGGVLAEQVATGWQNEGATDAWLYDSSDSEADGVACGGAESILPDLVRWSGGGAASSASGGLKRHQAPAGHQMGAHQGAAQISEQEPSSSKSVLVPEPRASRLVHPGQDPPAHGKSEQHLRAVQERTFSKVPDSISRQENILLETFLVIPRHTSSALVTRSIGRLARPAPTPPEQRLGVSQPSAPAYVAFK